VNVDVSCATLLDAEPGMSKPMEFFGRYIEVTPHSRLVWTNDEGGAVGPSPAVRRATMNFLLDREDGRGTRDHAR
jgi:hypothetical protein